MYDSRFERDNDDNNEEGVDDDDDDEEIEGDEKILPNISDDEKIAFVIILPPRLFLSFILISLFWLFSFDFDPLKISLLRHIDCLLNDFKTKE